MAVRAALDLALERLAAPRAVPDDPAGEFVAGFTAHLRDDADLGLVLPAARAAALTVLAEHAARLPGAPGREALAIGGDGGEAVLRRRIAGAKRLAALVAWWASAQPALAAMREATLGKLRIPTKAATYSNRIAATIPI